MIWPTILQRFLCPTGRGAIWSAATKNTSKLLLRDHRGRRFESVFCAHFSEPSAYHPPSSRARHGGGGALV